MKADGLHEQPEAIAWEGAQCDLEFLVLSISFSISILFQFRPQRAADNVFIAMSRQVVSRSAGCCGQMSC